MGIFRDHSGNRPPHGMGVWVALSSTNPSTFSAPNPYTCAHVEAVVFDDIAPFFDRNWRARWGAIIQPGEGWQGLLFWRLRVVAGGPHPNTYIHT